MNKAALRRKVTGVPLLVLSSLAAAALPVSAVAAAGVAYVSNQKGDVSVIDLDSLEVTRSISAYGKEPRGIGITADGKLLVVANREGGRVAVIDAATGQLKHQVKIGTNPEFVRTRGHLAFISFEPSSTGKPPPKPGTPEAAGKDDDDDGKQEPARIAVVDLKAGKLVRTIKGGLETEGIEFSADGKHILVTNETDHTVTVHEIRSGKLVHTVDTKPYGTRPRGIKMSPDGKTYVATLEHGNAILVMDAKYKPVTSFPTAEYPYGVSFDRSGDRLFVASARSKLLQVFDGRTFAPIKDITTGDRCWHFSFTPDDKTILLACGRSDEVLAIDATSLEVVKRIPDKSLPWGVVTHPKSMGSLDRPE